MQSPFAPASSYPGGTQALISAEELADLHGSDAFIVLDCRLRRDFSAGHLPGAVSFDVRALRHNPDTLLPDSAILAAAFGQLGVAPHKRVALAADRFTYSLAAFTWWLLRFLGHEQVSVLHGGMEAAKRAGLPLTTESSPVTPVLFASRPNRDLFIETDWLAAHLNDPGLVLIDARSDEEFAEGHIAHGSVVHLRHDLVFDPDTHALREPDALARLFSIIPPGNRVTYCWSGARSAVLSWALAACGLPAANYAASMQGWEGASLPVVRRVS